MTTFVRKGDRSKYDFLNEQCISAKCWAPGVYQHRAAAGAGMGTRSTGQLSFCCMTRAYHGCPPTIGHDPGLAKERKAEGWRKI